MTDSIKIHAEGTGKASIDALGASITAIDGKLNKLAGSALKAGEASKFLEAEVRKVQKAETGRTTAVTGLTKNIDALQAEITKLGRVGGATALKREFDSLKKEINSLDNVGFKSIDSINSFRAKLDQALGGVGAVLGKKRGLTQGQLDVFLDVANAVDASGKKVLGKVTTESEVIEKALLASGKRQAEAARKAGLLAAQAQVQAADTTAKLLAEKGRYTPYNANAMRPVYGTKMSLDETRKLLGMPDRNEMKTFAAQLKSQMSEELSTSKLRAGAATKMSLDETRKLLGMPDRAEVSKASAELRRWMQEEAAKTQALVRATARQQLTMPVSGVIPFGSSSSIEKGSRGALILPKTDNIPKTTQQVSALGAAVKQLTVHHQDLNSSLRGLAQGFGVISAGLSSMIPLVASFAVATTFVKTLKVGAEFQQSLFTVSEIAGVASAEMVTLRERVLQLGASTQYGPLELAEGLKVLTLAGLSATEAVGALLPTLRFSAVGDLPMQKAAETLVAVGTAYKVSSKNFSVVGDVIAKTAADTMASVDSMAESFRTASVVAQQYGVSLDDTAAALGALAQIGIKGTAAGTSFRNMIVELNKGSGKAAEGVRALGAEVQKADGSMRNIVEVMRDLSKGLVTKSGAAQQRLLQDISNERGAKALAAFQAEALQMINAQNPKLQEQVDLLFKQGKAHEANAMLLKAVDKAYDEMAKKREQAERDSAGFTFFASLEAGLTPLAQYKGLLASLQTDFVKAFSNSEDSVYLLGQRLREVFNSPEFQEGLNSLVSGLVSIASGLVTATKWVVEHQEAVVMLGIAYVALNTAIVRTAAMGALNVVFTNLAAGALAVAHALRGVATFAGLALAAKTALAAGVAGVTAGFSAAWAAIVSFGAGLAAITAPIWAVIAAVTALTVGVGYLAYKWATAAESAEESLKKQRAATADALTTSAMAAIGRARDIEKLTDEEIDEKRRIYMEMATGVTKDQATTKVHMELAQQRISQAYDELAVVYSIGQERLRSELKGRGPSYYAEVEANLKQTKEGLAAIQAARDLDVKKIRERAEIVRALHAAEKEFADEEAKKVKTALFGNDNKGGFAGKEGRGGKAAGEAERASLKAALAEHEIALKQINTLKAQAEKQTAAALAAEKKALFEINAQYADGAQARIDATTAVQLAMAGAEGSVMSRAEGEAKIAAIQLEGNRAELDQIRWTRDATAARYTEEVRILGVLKEQTLTKLRGALAVLKAEKAKLEPVKDEESHKENYVKITTEVEKLDEAIRTTTEDTKALDAAQQAYNDTMAKGETEFNKKLREQNNALKARQVTAQQELQTLKDAWKNRAKSTDELEAEEAVQQRLLATKLMEDARRKAAAGDIMAEQAKILADTAAVKAEMLEFKIAKDAAMSTDWYAAVEKALKDYASGLKNVAGEIANVFTKSFKGLEDVLTDFLTKGKADFKGFVKSILADLARIAVRQSIIGPMLGGFTSGMAGGGGGSMLGSLAGSAASSMMGGGASGGLLSGLGNTVGGWLGAGGAMSSASAAALSGAGTSLTGTAFTSLAADSAAAYGAAGTSAGMASGGSMMSGLSSAISAIPVWGWALMAAAAIAAIAGKGETRSGGQYGYSTDGTTVANARRGTTQSASGVGATFLEGPSGGTGDVAAVSLMNSAFKGINDLFKSVGSSETVTGFQSGYESSKNSRGGVFAGGTLASGKTFGESGKGDNYAGTLYEKTSAQTVSIEDAAKNYVTDLKQATVQAMQAATDLPKLIADKLKDLNAETMDDPALDALMSDIQNIIVSVNSFRDTLDTLPFTELRDMSFDAAAGLVQAVGGLDKLGTFTTNLSSYFENFYSEEEKRKNTVKNITGTLNKAGLAVSEDQVNTATKETFRQVVEQYAAMGTKGQDVYLALLSVNQAFSDLSTATGSFLDDLKSYTESFSTKKELRSTSVKEITDKFNKNTSGIQVTESMVSSAGIKDFRAAVEATKAMGPAGRSAYESLLSVNQEFLALGNDQIKLDKLLDTYGDLGSAADELVPPAEKLVDSWRKNKSAIKDLNDALDEALGTIKETTAAEKAVADVKKAVTNRDDLKEARKGINDTIDSIRLAAAKPADKVTLLKGKEAKLREEFATNPTATLFNKLTETTLARIKAEGELRQVNSDKEIAAQVKIDEMRLKSMQEQLSGFEALRDSAYELKKFVSDLKTGDLSALSPRDRLAEAKANFEETSRRAKAGDINAVNNLQGSAQTYLGVAKTNYGSATSQYAGIFKDVTDNVTQIADYATGNASGTSAIDLQIEEAKKQVAALTTLAGTTVDTSKEEIAALTELGALADGAIEEMDKSILSLTEVAREQILLLQAVVDSQEIELKVQIEKHKELIAVLDRIDENTDDTAATAVREASKV